MFRVENADFIADKLASELLPDQEFREVLKNALEAVDRRMRADGSKKGRVEFDVDWSLLSKSGNWYVCCTDDGDGMTRSELEKYTTTLAVQGAGQNQSLRGNQGMGLKISGPTRHKKGILIRSLKKGERTRVQVGWDGQQYGLIPIGPNDEVVMPVSATLFPSFVNDRSSGTVVTFLGNKDGDDTFAPAGRAKGWLFKYLNTRFFRLSDDSKEGVQVLVRVPSGDREEWPSSAEEAAERVRGRGKSFNLQVVYGTGQVWDEAADKQGGEWRGAVKLAGDPVAGLPPARMHWWVLPAGPGSDVSSRTHSGGSLAVLYDNELHDWRTSNQANPFFARLGVLFAKTRIAFVLEPEGSTITSDFARAHVLVNGRPVLESDAWLSWAEQFRAALPERIRQAMADEQARLELEDPDRAKRIRERLRDVMQLLRPRRFRSHAQGQEKAMNEALGAAPGLGPVSEPPPHVKEPKPRTDTGRGRGIGALLSDVDEEAGQPAAETSVTLELQWKWVSEAEAEDYAIVNGNTHGLHDRAAALAGTDGRTANILLLNRDFRGYQTILAAVNDWANAEGDDDKAAKIKAAAEEWVAQKLIEAVQGLRQLENGKTWITEHYDEAMSPVALTAAFMADRYHTLYEVKRMAGALRQARRGAEAAAVS
jgi:histidine kinase/DNA gyrase B/HSP90-like ATPase